MTSGDFRPTDGLVGIHDELDLAELFLYNSNEDDFPPGCDKGESLWSALGYSAFICNLPPSDVLIWIESSVFCIFKSSLSLDWIVHIDALRRARYTLTQSSLHISDFASSRWNVRIWMRLTAFMYVFCFLCLVPTGAMHLWLHKPVWSH